MAFDVDKGDEKAGARQGPTPGIVVREATGEDNDVLIALELESPLVMGDIEETYDRSPEFFACHRQKEAYRVVLCELDGRVAGVMAGVFQAPLIQGQRHKLVYVQQARVHPDFHGRRVAWNLANNLFAWGRELGAEGPYYLIAPENERSVGFVERGGGRWPADVTLLSFDVAAAEAGRAERVTEHQLGEAVRRVNATHAGEEFFEPLTPESLSGRLGRSRLYSIDNYYGLSEGGSLIAVGGLWDKGATTEQIHLDQRTGVTTRSRGTAVADWGFAAGREEAFAVLLRGLAAEAHALGRSTLTICEPSPGSVPDAGLPGHRFPVSLFTPTIQPPTKDSLRGLYVDMLYL